MDALDEPESGSPPSANLSWVRVAPFARRSELTGTPTDRFRIGRRHPEPGLDALASRLRNRT
ncbi:hypothetical protein GCM10009754_80300 [Amycolatopsis minnesotensis]|uniref:Uncharacterized protein n=1 Tax=Amycolatopsis minnesotensis TaxID=337894 RepID=A0ABP5E317_9PSEU